MKKLLLIEDDPAILEGLRVTLQEEHYEVISETDGQKGYILAREVIPDLVLLDVILPSMSGFQVCSKLKQEGWTFPIFLLTSLSEAKNRLNGLSRGADDYISKPFDMKELLLRIRNALMKSDQVRQREKILEEEFQKAREIQVSSLPRTQPKITGLDIYGEMIPAMYVGGDYYDYLQL